MGVNHSSHKSVSFDADSEVSLDHFQILRAIGKGSFGKVCIVQKKDTKKMFAMKYMNKAMCLEKEAVRNVMREVELLMRLDHPFLVNLWFTFQDSEDMFMVVDLLLGGDLRYHIQHDLKFDEPRVQLYICEIALALEYLCTQGVLHRDIKPDNMLLDEEGHVHITDFNVATEIKEGQLANSMSGTKPYMAPEVFATALEECPGYSFPADWWSLGTCAYEMLRGRRPYEIHTNSSPVEVKQLFAVTSVSYPSYWEQGMCQLLSQLLTMDPKQRLCNIHQLQRHPYFSEMDFDAVLQRKLKPRFIPSRVMLFQCPFEKKDHLNCDPTYELEEMIIEAKPLHKKKKRLAKQYSKRQRSHSQGSDEIDAAWIENLQQEFRPYNRERDLNDVTQMKKDRSSNNGAESEVIPEVKSLEVKEDISKNSPMNSNASVTQSS